MNTAENQNNEPIDSNEDETLSEEQIKEILPEDNPSEEEFLEKLQAGVAAAAGLGDDDDFEITSEEISFGGLDGAEDVVGNAMAEKDERIAVLEDQLRRSVAELDNYRKRTQKEMEDVRKFAGAKFAEDMSSVMENMIRALDSIPEDEIEDGTLLQNVHTGIKMTFEELKNAFDRNGVVRLAPESGEAFDHQFHQALTQVETDEIPAGSIVSTLHAGYVHKGRLLRPAMVQVAKAPAVAAADDAPEVDVDA